MPALANPCLITVTGLRNGPATQGDILRIRAVLTREDGTEVDPTTVRFKVRHPDRSKDTYTYTVGGTGTPLVTKTDTGNYAINFEIAEAGTYVFRWEVEGTYQGASELSQAVAQSAF